METKDILSYHMNVAGPILAEVLGLLLIGLIGIIAYGGYIVGKSVKPNVSYVLGINVNGDTPGLSSICFISLSAYLLILKK